MPFVGVALVSGVLSVLAPCVIGLLPALVGRSLGAGGVGGRLARAIVVIASLCTSIFVFTLLLKVSSALVGVPFRTWQLVAGVILVAFGIVTLFPDLWDRIAGRAGLAQVGARGRDYGLRREGVRGDLVLGASLGPVFSACSPTYAVIVAVTLPANFAEGALYMVAYLFGLAVTMFAVIMGGRAMVTKLGWSIDPHGWFKRILGVVFIVLGVAIATGLDKELLTFAVSNGWFDWQLDLEDSLQ